MGGVCLNGKVLVMGGISRGAMGEETYHRYIYQPIQLVYTPMYLSLCVMNVVMCGS